MEGTKIVAGELAAAFGPVLTDSGFTLIGLFVQPARIVLAQNLTDQTSYIACTCVFTPLSSYTLCPVFTQPFITPRSLLLIL